MVSPSGRGGYGDGCRLDVGGSVGGCALGMVHPAAWVIGVLRFGGRGKAALAFSPSPGLRKGTGGLSRSLDSPGRSPNRWEPPSVLWPSEPASWPRTCKPAFIKKQKGRLAASPPRPPAAWPRQAVRGRPVGSKPVRIKGSGVGPRCGPSASRDPRDRDQHHSTGFPTATEARKIRSNGGRLYCGV